ncbi:MAG: 3-methyl-2-oxobutanoate dehydrogenase subunit VorB [Elusimicrobiota bacterium]|jgi:2-oxoglutarate ferredoxin oxidoreductase subunit alpha|nr:3-methyl-2-oxobutanoate dehydrogenase subunit VorB [Elusimicrobiota bacterium]
MKELIKGNIALCNGALDAGLNGYFGYPITPQNEVPEYLSRRMVELGRTFIQAESEIAAANMVLGACATGKKAMTSSSSPGISLKQEAISYLAAQELPAVIANVQRGGPGLGNIAGSQADYFQAVKGGGHGDYKIIVLSPNSVQEMYDFSYEAFGLAQKYRTPVLILADGIIGQMMEPAEFNKPKIDPNTPISADWALTGAKGRPPRSIKSLLMKDGALYEHNLELQKKYKTIAQNEIRCEKFLAEDAEIILVAFGIASRIAKGAVKLARACGIKAGLLRPQTLWPFPTEIISSFAKSGVTFLSVELNAGQMVEDVKLAVNGKCEVDFLGKPGGVLLSEQEILNRLQEIAKRG